MTEAVPRPPIRHDRRGSAATGPVQKRIIDYPRAGKRGVLRWIPSWKLILGLGLFGAASVIVLIGVAYARTSVPGIADITEAQTSIVYYDDGKTELGRFQVQNRVILTDDKIPEHLKDAVIAAEDRTFWTNKGISPRGIARAAWNNFNGGSLQGGSTLTQQYVKNVLLNTQDRTYKRKFKEFFIAVKVANDDEIGKAKILNAYLNTIYFGRNAYGVEAASQAYFRKPAAKLSVSESAFLAGIINGPELYDPMDGKDSAAAAQVRWNYVLDSMVQIGKLTEQERAEQEFPKIKKPQTRNTLGGYRGYLMDMVRKELKGKLGLPDDEIDRSGLRITTTFDKRLMDAAYTAVKEQMPDDAPKSVQVGLATIDPRTGAVKAIYGGPDFLKRQFNNATQARAQAGSTFKPFTLVAGLEEGISLKTRFNGNTRQTFEGYPRPVVNFDSRPWGQVDLLTATANSINTVYVALNLEVEAKKTKEVAVRAGLPDEDAAGLDSHVSNVLGTASLHPIDMASAYATFADQGVRHEKYVVQKVTGPVTNWDAKEKGNLEGKRVFKKDVMADAVYAMQQVVERGSGSYAKGLGRPVAGKTGTSSNNRSAWFVGFTPQLSTAVALFRPTKDGGMGELGSWGGRSQITGGSFPVQIWTEYMKEALDGTKVEQFPEPAWIGGELRSTSTVTGPPGTEEPERPTKSPGEDPTPSSTPSPTVTATPEKTAESSPTPSGDSSPSPSGDDDDPPTSPSPSP